MRFKLFLLIFFSGCGWAWSQQASLVPNPFSPFVTAQSEGNIEPGLAVRLASPTDTTAHFVQVRIYAGNGTLIRTLLTGGFIPPEGRVIYWDALDNQAKLVRNGRYTVVIQWSADAQGAPSHTARLSVVVFK